MARRTTVVKEQALPPAPTILGALDRSTRRTLGGARTFATSSIRALLPKGRTGNLREGTRARLRTVPEGYSLAIIPSASAKFSYRTGVTPRQVARWVEDGTTGPIVPRHAAAFHLPTGWVSGEVAGQKPQKPFARFRQGPGQAVEQIIVDGAAAAAKQMERVIR